MIGKHRFTVVARTVTKFDSRGQSTKVRACRLHDALCSWIANAQDGQAFSGAMGPLADLQGFHLRMMSMSAVQEDARASYCGQHRLDAPAIPEQSPHAARPP